MAEIILSPLVSLLVENLATHLGLSLIDLGGTDGKLKKLSKRLKMIQAVLQDAEDKQLYENSNSIQLWLKDFQKLAYDIDDVLDDLATEAGRRRQMIWPLKLVYRFNLKAVYDMNRKIGEICNSLKELDDQKNLMELQKWVGGKSEKPRDQRHPQASVMDRRVYGRDEEISAILALLKDDRDGSHFRVISIVGMGGIGKTTMAQSLYNNEQVERLFPERPWVCVLEDFDVLKVSKMIYEQVYKTSCEFTALDTVQVKLREKLSMKKFLVVLDDVWNQDYGKWELLSAPFHAGLPGSTIIVTTRDDSVANTMGSNYSNGLLRKLKELSDDDCLSLLAQHALERRNFDGHPQFKEVGEEIAKRCKGLPLAAMSLGGLLRSKECLEEWEKVSTSKIWELESNGIIPSLRVSYHLLPQHLKPLFTYCSIFPKGHEFVKQELIMLWMAQGFLKQSSSGEPKQMEELGREYFSELLSMSFFQHSTNSWGRSKFVMHDLNNDLAQFVTGLTHLRLDDKILSNEQHNFEDARHASFISDHEYADFNKFKALNAAPCLRTLLLLCGQCSRPSLVLKDFPRLLCLRALSFNGYGMREVPKLIGDLHHLRYLDFSYTRITELPDSICGLYNLQTLLLRGCHHLVQLPSKTRKLINLRHLDISDTYSLRETPKCIGLLSCLRTMPKFFIETSDGHGISELNGLNDLQGELSIYGIQKVNVKDAVEANLLRKEGLSELVMKWGREFDASREKGIDFEVLDALKPSTKLKSLEINFYGGQKFPSWVGHHSFNNMVFVRLSGCKSCTCVPPLGQLTSLKELFIEGMYGVKIVGPEFLGVGICGSKAFQSLKVLYFLDMEGWEEWSVISSNGDENLQGAFPCLEQLYISGCMKLNKVSLAKIPSLESLVISGCSEMVLRSMVGVGSMKKLEIRDISGLSKLDEGIIGCLGEVEDLTVHRCKELRYLWEEEVACQVLDKLKSLKVDGCEQVESLGDKEQLLPHNLESLKLGYCDKLEKMPNWQNNLTSLGQLDIEYCKKLEDGLGSTTYEFSNLMRVTIDGCPRLKWLHTSKQLLSSP